MALPAALQKVIDKAPVPIIIAIRDKTSVAGMTPRAIQYIEAAAVGAATAGLSEIRIVAGAGGGHKSHAQGTEWDITGANSDGSKWSTQQRVQVADAARVAGADRFGIYDIEKGLGAGTLHLGYSGKGRPAAVWGAKGLTSGAASQQFSDPNEVAFLTAYRGGKPLAIQATANKPAMAGFPPKPSTGKPSPGQPLPNMRPGQQKPNMRPVAQVEAVAPEPMEAAPPEAAPEPTPEVAPVTPPQGEPLVASLSPPEFSPIKDERLVDVLKPPPPIPYGETLLSKSLTMDDIFSPPVAGLKLPPIPDPVPIAWPENAVPGIPRVTTGALQRLAALSANQDRGLNRTMVPNVVPFKANDLDRLRAKYPGMTDAEFKTIVDAFSESAGANNDNRR